jgi:transposase
MTDQDRIVYGGVDTHKHNHVAAVVDDVGRILATETFPAKQSGYRALETWLASHGQVAVIGVEGTGAYGLGLARYLTEMGHQVIEVNRPNRQLRRRHGKTDAIDAEAAARAALNREADAKPKSHDGIVESIRAIRVVLTSTRNTRVRVNNQMDGLILTAPTALRAALEALNADERAQTVARFRVGTDARDVTTGTKMALRILGRQYLILTQDLNELRGQIDELTEVANPALRQAVGVGPDTASALLVAAGDNPERLVSEAGFAALCGTSPVAASSGKTVNYRLNRGGNRQANQALWRIATVRLNCHQPTKDYASRRKSEGMSQRGIIRCLKRYIAREVYQHLTNPKPVESRRDLRPRRDALGATLRTVAQQISISPAHLSRIERGTTQNQDLSNRYRAWLTTQEAA